MSSQTSPAPLNSSAVTWPVYLVLTLLTTVALVLMSERVKNMVPLPDGWEELNAAGVDNIENATKARAQFTENRGENLKRAMASMGGVIALFFGLGVGICSKRLFRGILAVAVAAGVGGGLAWYLAPHIAALPLRLAERDVDSLNAAMIIHSASWGVMLLGFGIAIGIATGSIRNIGIATMLGLLGGAIGVVVAILVGANWERFSKVEDVFVEGTNTKLLWASMPMLFAGLLYTWSVFRDGRMMRSALASKNS